MTGFGFFKMMSSAINSPIHPVKFWTCNLARKLITKCNQLRLNSIGLSFVPSGDTVAITVAKV
jgi:hypothetical protein